MPSAPPPSASAPITAPLLRVGPTPRRPADYADLMRRVKQAGLLRRRPGYYMTMMAVTGTMLAAGWTVFVLLGNTWWQLVVAGFLAVVFTQLGFIGHDAGHQQIFGSKRANYVVGILHGNLAIGLSYGWWVDKHNRHHANPNQEDHDPDIDIGALAFSSAQARGKRGLTRFVARHQRYLFFPLLLLEAMQLHVSSVRAVSQRTMPHRRLESLTLGLHLAGYLGAVLLVLPPGKAVAFIALQQALFGLYLGCSFAPNHKGMPILAADDKTDFLRRQVLTSRDVRGSRMVDLALGALNYQTEHHLFPSMPRPHLRHAKPLVRAFCDQHSLPYCETTLLRSYAQAIRYLHQVGEPLRVTGTLER